MNYFENWSNQSNSFNRSDSFKYLERKSLESHSVLFEYCSYNGEDVVDLGCGAGELLEHLISKLNITQATDFSSTMLATCKKRISKRYPLINLKYTNAGIEYLPLLNEEYWISTGALSQYSSLSQIAEILYCFKENSSAKYLILFDTIDPVRYFLQPLIGYKNYSAGEQKNSSSNHTTALKLLDKFKQFRFALTFSYKSIESICLSVLRSVQRLPGSLMGFGVKPTLWKIETQRLGLGCYIVSSREFEYRYHVLISKGQGNEE